MKFYHKLLAILLAFVLVCSPLLTQPVLAAQDDIRPGYMTLEEAAAYVRKELAAQKTDITVKLWFDSPYTYSERELWELLKAEVMKHTGVPDEGDYLYWSFQQVGYYTTEEVVGQTHYVTFDYISATYNATKEQEQELDAKLAEVMSSLELESKTDYEKVEAICRYICENVRYSQDFVAAEEGRYTGDPEDLKVFFSAYGALVLGEATCQGYGSLVYRMMLEAGIDCRLIAGDDHGWNIVKLGDLYYYLDTTGSNVLWEQEGIIPYFLQGSASFRAEGHRAWTNMFNPEFLDAYPISALDYGQENLAQQPEQTVIGSGQCGPNVHWQLTADGELTISGQGKMWDATLTSELWETPNGLTERWDGLKGYIRSVNIEEGVTSIGDYAFFNCPVLEEISISDSITYIGSDAFTQCEGLKHIDIGSNVTSAGSYVFDRCVRLESVTIGSGLKRISTGMFTGCVSLKTVSLAEGIEVIGDGAFSNCPSLVQINIPHSVTTLEACVFQQSFDPEAKLSFTVSETITQVGFAAFEQSGLMEIIWNAQTDTMESGMFNLSFYLEKAVLNDNICTFGERVFCDCDNLSSVTLPNQLETLGECAFQNCISLEQITLPDCLTEISRAAFIGCERLQSMVIPENVTTIGLGAFNGCYSLEQLVIPAPVTTISEASFIGCHKLIFLGDAPTVYTESWDTAVFFATSDFALYYPADNDTWTVDLLISFCPDDYPCYAYYPDGTVAAEPTPLIPEEGSCGENTRWTLSDDGVLTISGNGEIADAPEFINWHRIKPYVQKVVIEEGVTRIGYLSFVNCEALTHVTIAASVTDIGDNAFSSTALEVVVFQGDAPVIGSSAFPQEGAFTVYYPKENDSYTNSVRSLVGSGAKSWKQAHASTEEHTLEAAPYSQDQHSFSCAGCPDVFFYEAHRYSGNCDNSCDDCGAWRSVSHNFDQSWLYNEYQHWRECGGCDFATDPAFHNFDEGSIQGDEIFYTCKTCGYEKVESNSTPTGTEPTTQPTDAPTPPDPADPPSSGKDDSKNSGNFTIIIAVAVAAVAVVGVVLILRKKK